MKRKLLFAIVALVCSMGTWAYQTPEANGIYYLYNPETGLFLSRGAGYGTAVWADNFGIPVTLIENNGGYRLQFLDQPDQYVSDKWWSWADGAVDRSQTYTLSTLADGKYKLINQAHGDENRTLYIAEGADAGGFTHQIASNGKYGDNCNENWDVWQFLSASERNTIIADRKATIEANIATSLGYTLSGGQTLKSLVENEDEFAFTDKTNSVTNAALTHNYEGWTYAKKNSGNNPSGQNGNGVEVFQGCGTFSQTVESLTNGLYKVTVSGFYRDGSNANCSTNADWKLSNAYLEANGNQTMIADWASDRTSDTEPNSPGAAKTLFDNGKYLNEVYALVTDGTLNISIAQPGGATANRWFLIYNVTLTYYSNAVSDDDATAILADAQALANEVKENSVKTALNNAMTTFDGTRTIANYNALSSAMANANASVTAYANAKAYLDEAETILANTNVYTATAYATYYTTPKSKYDAGTLTTEEANALVKTSTGWHSTNTIDDILLSSWTIGGEPCANYDKSLYINTWSTEGATDGSEFLAPFFEYWVGDANSLGATTLVSTVTGLTANATYSFTIRARVRQTNDKTKIENGITMKVGDGTAVDISAGTIFGSGPFYIGNFSALGQTDADGKLVCTITVAENSNISWLSFYNCKYTEGEDLSAYIADYEFALANVNKALTDDVAYTVMQTDLQTAATTYANVDNTDKAALIAAKEALDDALTAYNAIVGPLRGNDKSKWDTTGNNGSFQVNTWSTEGNTDGSGMTTPFTQNWIGRGTSLTDATMSYTIEGLTPGYYKVTALIRSLNEAGGATPAGSFIFANDAIERAYGTNSSDCTNGVYGNPVVYGLVGSDGKLTIGVKIIKANVNWVSWKNFVYEFVGTTLTQDIADNLTEEARTFADTDAGAAVDQQADAISALATLSDAKYTAAGQAIEAAYKAASATLSVKAGKWGTFIAPFDVTIPENVSAYTVTGANGSNVTLSDAIETTIDANTPVLLKNDTEADVTKTFYGESTATEDSYKVGLLTGVYTAQTIPASTETTTNYVLQTQNGTQAFYKVDEDFTATANKCFLSVAASTGEGVKAFFLDFGDEDAINGIEADMQNATIYNVAGQRINKAQKGIYIVNGKKVLVK